MRTNIEPHRRPHREPGHGAMTDDPRVTKLSYRQGCAECGREIDAGTRARWFPAERAVRCLDGKSCKRRARKQARG